MRVITGLVFFACAIGVSAQLKVPSFQLSQGWGSTRPGMAVQSLKSFSTGSTLPQRLNPLQPFHKPPVRPDMVFPWASRSSKAATAVLRATKEAKEEKKEAPAMGIALKNVYGEDIKDCGTDAVCTFDEASDLGIQRLLCASATKFAQVGVPSDKLTRKLQCKSILGSSLVLMPEGREPTGSADIPLCDAISSDLLTSQSSKDLWNEEVGKVEWSGLSEGTYLWDNWGKTSKVTKGSKRARKFRNSVDVLCRFCAVKAPNDSAKKALDSSCKALGWKESLVQGRPFDIDSDLFSQPSPDGISIFAVAFLGLLVSSGLAFTLRYITAKKVPQDGAQYNALM